MRGMWAVTCLILGILALGIGAGIWSERVGDARNSTIHQEGYDAGRARIPVEACPEDLPDRVRAWKRGWIEGRKGAAP